MTQVYHGKGQPWSKDLKPPRLLKEMLVVCDRVRHDARHHWRSGPDPCRTAAIRVQDVVRVGFERTTFRFLFACGILD